MQTAPLRRTSCLFLALAFSIVCAASFAAENTWQKYESDHLTVFSDCSPERTKALLRQFSAFQYALRTVLVGPDGRYPHTTVLYFSEAKELTKWAPPRLKTDQDLRTSYILKSISNNRLIAVSDNPKINDRLIGLMRAETEKILKEYDEDMPGWLQTALLSVIRRMEIHRNTIEFGGPDFDQRNQLRRMPWLSWESLVSDANSGHLTQATERLQNQLWLFGDWLLFGQPTMGASFEPLLRTVRGNASTRMDIFEAGLGISDTELNRRLKLHLEEQKFPHVLTFNSSAVESNVKMSPATLQEMHLNFFYLSLGQVAAKITREEFDAATAIGPIPTKYALASLWRALLEEDIPQAKALARSAIAAGSSDPLFYRFSAQTRLLDESYSFNDQGRLIGIQRSSIEVSPSEALNAIQELETAMTLGPVDRNVLAQLDYAISSLPALSPEDAARFIAPLSEPSRDPRLRYLRGKLHWLSGALAEANADFQFVIHDNPDGPHARDAKAWCRFRVARQVNQAVDKLLRQDCFTEARQLLENAHSQELFPLADEDYTRLVARIDELQKWDFMRMLFREKYWDELDRTAAEFIQTYPKSPHVPAVINMQAEARRHL